MRQTKSTNQPEKEAVKQSSLRNLTDYEALTQTREIQETSRHSNKTHKRNLRPQNNRHPPQTLQHPLISLFCTEEPNPPPHPTPPPPSHPRSRIPTVSHLPQLFFEVLFFCLRSLQKLIFMALSSSRREIEFSVARWRSDPFNLPQSFHRSDGSLVIDDMCDVSAS